MTDVSRDGRSPFAQWQWVEVDFDVSNTDTRIGHGLHVDRPDNVHYIVVQKTADATIYHASTEFWTKTSIVLRSNLSPCTVQLLLFVLV